MATSISYLTEDDMKRLEEAGEINRYGAKDIIVHQQASGSKLFFVRKGMVQIDFSRLYGNDVLAYLNDGDMFGEVSFLDQADSSANVSAVEEVETLEVPHASLEPLLEADSDFAARFYRTIAVTLARRIRNQNRK